MSDTPKRILDEIQRVKDEGLGGLNLSGLSKIPEEIRHLSQLTHISLEGSYSEIPDWIGELKQLLRLELQGNYNEIPSNISDLYQLKFLLLDGSYTVIPDQIGNLNQLKFLLLAGNYAKIPNQIGDIKQLTRLILSSSIEIILPPPEVVGNKYDADIEAIRQYFEDMESENTSKLYEAKLLIVGEPGAGKTSLAVKLMDDNAPMPAQEATTRGIDIDYWEFPVLNGENFRVNIWDFGGQEIYKSTHQFFLTKDSVYALVLDNRKEEDNLVYWLQAVELLSDNSPLLIIKNERDNRVRQLNERQLKERFSNIQDVKDTNLGTNQGLAAIKDAIREYMQDLPHFGTELPQSWVEIRDVLEHDARNYITYDQFLDICAENNLHDSEKARIILGYLHNLGVCLHFEDDPLLSRIVILKPEWATAAVYAVLDNNDVIKANGVFTLKDLIAIWQKKDYADMKFELLNLMKKFQLCYPIDEHKLIAPQLLEDNQPDYKWEQLPDIEWKDFLDIEWESLTDSKREKLANNERENFENLMLRYKYDFMPKGIVSRLIVVMHELIFDNKVWKTGVVIQHSHAAAEIKENYKGNEITIRTRGFNCDGLLYIIMYELEKLHKPFGKQLNVTKTVPCNCSQCEHDTEPHFYDYVYIEGLTERNLAIPCPRSFEMIDAQALLKDIRQPEIDDYDEDVLASLLSKSAFISYKNKESWQSAQIIHDRLAQRGLNVFYDKENLRGGKFAETLFQEIATRDNLIIVLVPDTLQSQWVVDETEMAFKLGKNVVPVLIDGMKMEDLDIPDEISKLRDMNAVTFSQEFLDASIERIASFLK